jgi:EF hand domain-containing protein
MEKPTMFPSRLFLIALSTLSVSALHAQTAPTPATPPPPGAMKPPPPREARPSAFDDMDTNHDGFVSRDEFVAFQKKRFDEFDTNHDGKIDAKEVASSPPLMERNVKTAERMIKQWDANGDGVVTADEYKKSAEERFARQDKEGTGKIARPPAPPMKGAMPPQKMQQPLPQPQPQPKKP